jgi:nitrite reductase (NADH) large subunit
MGRKRLLVVGNGMATDRLLDELSARDALSDFAITIVGEECFGAYNRVLLSKLLGGAEPDDLVTKPVEWYQEHGIRFLRGR